MPNETVIHVENGMEFCRPTPEEETRYLNLLETEGRTSLASLGRRAALSRMQPHLRTEWHHGPVWAWHALKLADYERMFGEELPTL